MGLLDIPAPLFSALDGWLAGFLPPLVRLAVWSALIAIVSMELYRLLSPQKRIAGLKTALQRQQKAVSQFDGAFEEAWPMIRTMLGLALRRVAVVLPATVIGSLPVLMLIVWLDGRYGGEYPEPGQPVAVQVADGYDGRWVDEGRGTPRAEITTDTGAPVAEVPLAAPVPVIHKWQWWNALIGNPAGYLPDDAPMERVEVALPRQQLLHLGPGWMRGWEVFFFAALTLFAFSFKSLRRIE
ncbi:hypothetical protein FDP22_21680 (plasmid) [Paroceanicella profunda]|uniref:Uncharacterized protein n=1 Tax=Paroceanicella profunda TaxID=2579971 RepID=A0A5B8G3D5_9RHOB|nr:hypothetical protein [Paroceanicella profunda]QDL94480.1 hypothetical protein FDP22_21680 [Paroceanicella profunda]